MKYMITYLLVPESIKQQYNDNYRWIREANRNTLECDVVIVQNQKLPCMFIPIQLIL